MNPAPANAKQIQKARDYASNTAIRALLLRTEVLDAMTSAPTLSDRARVEREYRRAIKAHELIEKISANLSKLVGVSA